MLLHNCDDFRKALTKVSRDTIKIISTADVVILPSHPDADVYKRLITKANFEVVPLRITTDDFVVGEDFSYGQAYGDRFVDIIRNRLSIELIKGK